MMRRVLQSALPLFFLLTLAVPAWCGVAFHDQSRLLSFGLVLRGGSNNQNHDHQQHTDDDYEMAQERIFQAVETAEHAVLETVEKIEHAVEDAVEQEVDTLFHEVVPRKKKEEDLDLKKSKLKDKADKEKARLAAKANRLKADKKTEEKDKDTDYTIAEDRIFHAVEDVEKAALHAAERLEHAVEHVIEEEVDTLFHSSSSEKKEDF